MLNILFFRTYMVMVVEYSEDGDFQCVMSFLFSILHNINYNTNVFMEQNGEYRVFDIISDITTRQRIISIDIMSKPFCKLPLFTIHSCNSILYKIEPSAKLNILYNGSEIFKYSILSDQHLQLLFTYDHYILNYEILDC